MENGQSAVSRFSAKPVGEVSAISQGDAFPVYLMKFDTTGLIHLSISCTINSNPTQCLGITVRHKGEPANPEGVAGPGNSQQGSATDTVLCHPSLHKTSC